MQSVPSTEEANSAKMNAVKTNTPTKTQEPASSVTTSVKSAKDPDRTTVTTVRTSKFSSIKFHSIECTTRRPSSTAHRNASLHSNIKFSPTPMKARTDLIAQVYLIVRSTEALKYLTFLWRPSSLLDWF